LDLSPLFPEDDIDLSALCVSVLREGGGEAVGRGTMGLVTGDHDLGTAFLDKVHKSKYLRKIVQASSKSPGKHIEQK